MLGSQEVLMVHSAGLPTWLCPAPSEAGPTPKAHPHLSGFPHLSPFGPEKFPQSLPLSPALGSLHPSSGPQCPSLTWTGRLPFFP